MFRRAARPETLLYASLGAAVMGIWSASAPRPAARCSGSAGRGRSSCSSPRRRLSRSCCCRSRSRCRPSACTAWPRRCSGAGSPSASASHIVAPVRVRRRGPRHRALDRRARLPDRGRPSSATGTRGRSGTCSSTRSGSSAGSSSRSRCCRPGCSRSPGCSHRPGASTRSARPRSAGPAPRPRGAALAIGSRGLAVGVARVRSGCSGRRAPGRDAGIDMTDVRVFFIGGLTQRTARCSTGCRPGSTSRACWSRRCFRSCCSPTSGARRTSSRTSST